AVPAERLEPGLRGPAEHRRLTRARELDQRPPQHLHAALPGCGAGDLRPHDDAGTRVEGGDRNRAVRTDAQSVGRAPLSRRLVGRRGGDGGGLIRIPAGYCGLFGFRAGRGRMPQGPQAGEGWEGANSEGVLTRSVRDSAAMLDLLCGTDVGAPFVHARPAQPFADALRAEPGRLRIGMSLASPVGAPVAGQAVDAVRIAAELLESLGHHVEPAEPQIDGAVLAQCFL